MTTTCGIFLYSVPDKRFLICHATHARWNQWTIPKGHPDTGELPFAAAVRELKEETGVILNELEIIAMHKIPSVKYQKSNKTLEAFLVITGASLVGHTFQCSTMVDNSFPEIDKWKLVGINEMDNWVHESQRKNLGMIRALIEA